MIVPGVLVPHCSDFVWCCSDLPVWTVWWLSRGPCHQWTKLQTAGTCWIMVFFIFMNELYCFTLSISSKMNKNSLKFNRVNTIRTFKRYIILCFTVRKNSHLKDFCGADNLYPTRYPHLLFLCICDYEHTGRYIFGWPIVTWQQFEK